MCRIGIWNGESLTGEHFMGKDTGNHTGKEEKNGEMAMFCLRIRLRRGAGGPR